MKSILISIIMPVYNPGAYLYISLNMILEQSYRNFELICIDDASTDNSRNILYEYAKKDDRVRVYMNERNCGAAASRNRGIELAKGDYVLFVDADDMFENQLLEKNINVIEKQMPDMVLINYNVFHNNEFSTKDNRHPYYFFSKLLCSYSCIRDCPKEFICDIQLAPYSKLYKKKFIEKNELRFQNLKSSNDIYFGLMAVFLSETIAHTEEYIYLIHVREHEGEFRISNNRNPFDNFSAYKYLMEEMQKKGIWKNYGTIVQEKFVRGIMFELMTGKPELAKSFYSFLQTKGINQILLCNSLNYRKLSTISHKIVGLLKTEIYENILKSYNEIEWFSILIEDNKERIRKLFCEIEGMGKRCAIWGAGKNGGSLAKFCAETGCICEGLIDNDVKKENTCLYGYRVYHPQEILKRIDIIIILDQNYFNEIFDQVSKMVMKIELISLDLYLRYMMGLEECRITTS